MSIKNSNDTIGNRTRELPAASSTYATACPYLNLKPTIIKNRAALVQPPSPQGRFILSLFIRILLKVINSFSGLFSFSRTGIIGLMAFRALSEV